MDQTEKKSNTSILTNAKYLAILIPLILIVYFGISYYKAYNYKDSYSIDLNESNFKNTKLPLYINEDQNQQKFKPVGEFDNKKYAEVLGSPISLIFKPKEYLLNKSIAFSTDLKGDGDWEISTYCDSCENKYNFIPYYYGSINNYFLLKTFDNLKVYAKNNNQNTDASNNIDEFIVNSIPTNSSLRILNNSYPVSKILNSNYDFIPDSTTEFNYTIRGEHELYTYLSGKLDFEFIKRDLNKYDGSDEISVKVYDVSDQVVKEIVVEDDGINIKDPTQVSSPISKRIEMTNILPGVYRIKFEDNNSNPKNDWVIDKIKINSNKLVFSNYVYAMQENNLYTESYEDKILRINVYDNKYLDNVVITDSQGKNTDVALTEKDLFKSKDVNVASGSYNIYSKGNITLTGFYFAKDQKSYFNPFRFDLSKINNQDFVIGNYDFSKENDWIKVQTVFNKTNYQLLDNQIKIVLRNPINKKQFEKENSLINQGYVFLAKLDDYKIYGQKKLKSYNEQYDNIINWMKNSITYGSSVDVGDIEDMSSETFINNSEPKGFSNSEQNELVFSLRGSHEFLTYLKDNAVIHVEKTDLNNYKGADIANIVLSDAAGNEICSTVVVDDNNETNDNQTNIISADLTCDNLEPKVYKIRVFGEPSFNNVDNDFLITKLSINSNKIIIKDKIVNTQKIDLYLNNSTDTELQYYYWLENHDQTILINDLNTNKKRELHLTKEDIKKSIKDNLTKDEKMIIINNGYLSISGSNFALKSSDWFTPYALELRENQNSDFSIIKSPYSDPVYIKSFEINVN